MPTFLSSEEPKPGEPLSEEQEQILSDGPAGAPDRGEDHGQVISPEDGEAQEAAGLVSELATMIAFDEADVRNVLEDGFAWLAKKFESDHWKLSENQSKMLARPVTLLASTGWQRLVQLLPDLMLKACTSTPGLAGTVLAGAIVVGPKTLKQMAISRERKMRNATPVNEPIEMPQRQQTGPVGAVNVRSSQPLQ